AELIAAKDIREGDLVEVTRAGEVIPQILGPVKDRRTGAEKAYKMPERCPSCGSQVEHPQDEVMTYCPNISCPSRILESIVHLARHFGTMDALAGASAEEVGEVRGIGPAIGEAVVGFFTDTRNKDLLKSLARSGLTLKETATATGPRPLADLTFVVTGTLPTLSRQQARDLIEAAG